MSEGIDPARYTRSIEARHMRGAAALMEALELIGATGVTDHDMARVIVDNELELRSMLSFVLAGLVRERSGA
jgi:hypothetical protein